MPSVLLVARMDVKDNQLTLEPNDDLHGSLHTIVSDAGKMNLPGVLDISGCG
jgi:hypothetical protein